jgi:uncharacterized membrane protein
MTNHRIIKQLATLVLLITGLILVVAPPENLDWIDRVIAAPVTPVVMAVLGVIICVAVYKYHSSGRR